MRIISIIACCMVWSANGRRAQLQKRRRAYRHPKTSPDTSERVNQLIACFSASRGSSAAWLVPDTGGLPTHAYTPQGARRVDVAMKPSRRSPAAQTKSAAPVAQRKSADLKPAGAWLEAVGGNAGWDHGTKLAQSKKSDGPPAFLTDITFQSMNIHNSFLSNLNKLGLTKMTDIQAETFKHARQGKDILARARTGTGKTVAFLLPVLERFAADQQSGLKPPRGFHCVVVSPTRELAQQICAEGQRIMQGSREFTIDYCVGGTNINTEANRLRSSDKSSSFNILVATCGRFLDHAESTPEFKKLLQSVQVLILDEADQMLEMGFRPEIEKILKLLPPGDSRQSLLFSATVAPEIRQIAKGMLKKDSAFVDTVGEAESTHEKVAQKMCTVPFEQSISALVAAVYKHMAENPNNYKIMVFFSTARVTGFMSKFFNSMGLPVLEQHSRKTQKAREKTSASFKAATRAILFSSDVSARGMDFPDVTLIVQVGLTERDQYIHRLGRTARSTGVQGSGLLIAAPFEQPWLAKTLKGLPIEGLAARGSDSVLDLESTLTEKMCKEFAQARSRVALDKDLLEAADRAYGAWLGFNKQYAKTLGCSKTDIVQHANSYSKVLGCPEIPALQAKTVGKMGLKGIPGLNILGKGVIHGDGAGGASGAGGAGARSGSGGGGGRNGGGGAATAKNGGRAGRKLGDGVPGRSGIGRKMVAKQRAARSGSVNSGSGRGSRS